MNLRFNQTTFNEILNSKNSRPVISKILFDDIKALSKELKVERKRLYAEVIIEGLPRVIKKHKLNEDN